ncbi:MAG: 30S ribosomal protein S1 [Anaerolineaceae bacterium]|nr:30S ribosomal protein S1 [Anaerolineaceae bacterium]
MEGSVVAEKDLKPKMSYKGKVVKTSLAGALVQIGSDQPAVLHVSQIVQEENENSSKNVSELLEIGQEIDVWIKKVKDDHVELTMIKPLDLEWREIKKEMVVKGKIVRMEKFGAFVEIGAERPGLVHISEMAHGYVKSPDDILKDGDEIEAQVIEVNRKKKQIKLSMKALQPEPVKEEPPKPAAWAKDKDKDKDKDRRLKKKKTKRTRSSGGSSGDFSFSFSSNESGVAEPTAMEVAIREAMEKAKSRQEKPKTSKAISQEQEKILERTLESKSS